MPVALQTISDFSLFASLKPDTQEELAQACVVKHYSVSEIIQMQDDPCEFVGFVRSGSAMVFRIAPNGNEQIVSVVTTGMHFNTVPALDEICQLRACVRAISPLTLWVIPVEKFIRLIQAHGDLAYVILKDFGKRLDHLVKLVDELSLHSVRGRLAKFLLDQAKDNHFSKIWTQDEIAAHLGTVRDVIGRTLRSFRESGLIERKNGGLTILDPKGLEEEANS